MKTIKRGVNPFLEFVSELIESDKPFLFALMKGADIKGGHVTFTYTYNIYFKSELNSTLKQDIDIFLHENKATIKKRYITGVDGNFWYTQLNKGMVKKLTKYLSERYLKEDIDPIIRDFEEGADGIIYC